MMFQKINKFRKRFLTADVDLNKAGQVGIVLVFIVALALIFYGVTLNFSKVTENKTSITRASNTGASILASQMASYGQLLFKQQMGGKVKRCKTSLLSIFGFILALAVLIFTLGQGYPLTHALVLLSIASVALSAISLVLDLAVIQPGITRMWNKIQQETLTPKDNFLESGIQAAIQAAATDTATVVDMHDLDNDGVFGIDRNTRLPRDRVSRFAVYYDARVRGVQATRDREFIEDFINDTDEFLYEETDSFGIHDPVGENAWDRCRYHPHGEGSDPLHPLYDPLLGNVNVPSECNPCCLPPDAVNREEGGLEDLVPFLCDCVSRGECTVDQEIGTATTCVSRPELGPYVDTQGAAPGIPAASQPDRYAYVYDPFYQNIENDPGAPAVVNGITTAFTSLLQNLGFDDENPAYLRDVNGVSVPVRQNPLADGNNFFTVDDATSNVFKALHYLDSWGLDLSSVNAAASVANNAGEECFWYDWSHDGGACNTPLSGNFPFMVRNTELNLPVDPSILVYNNSAQVDGPMTVSGVPVGVDAIVAPSGIIAPDNRCALGPDICWTDGLWKKGADSFCSAGDDVLNKIPENDPTGTHYVYNSWCEKNRRNVGGVREFCVEDGDLLEDGEDVPDEEPTVVPCACDDAGVDISLWRDDALDEIRQGLTGFIEEYEKLGGITRAQRLANTIEFWYDDIAPYIETQVLETTDCTPFLSVDSFCDADENDTSDVHEANPEGRHFILQDMGQRMHVLWERLSGWLNTPFADDDAWCVPEPSTCQACNTPVDCPAPCPAGEYEVAERLTFDDDGDDIQGEIGDVIQCLNYNIEGYDLSDPTVINATGTNKGNDYRWTQCGQSCLLEDCYKLPRSQVGATRDGFDVTSYPAPDASFDVLQQYNTCLDNCNSGSCTGLPGVGVPFNSAQCTSGPFYNAVVAARDGVRSQEDRDVNAFLTCLDSCSVANCRRQSNGGPLPDSAPYTYSNAIGVPFDGGDCANWGPGNIWWNDVNGNMSTANPPCDLSPCNPWIAPGVANPACPLGSIPPRGWLFEARHSAIEAANQVAKFKQRRTFLLEVFQRVQAAANILNEGKTQIANFLTGPAAQLVEDRCALEDDEDTGLPNEVIYGWRGDPPPSRQNLPEGDANHDMGYWSIVKVKAAIPLRCLGNCGPGWTPSAGWPKVITYTKGFLGTTRCYELVNRVGGVKVRVIRRDQERDAGVMTLPNGTSLWDFRSQHPRRNETVFPDTLENVCRPITDHEGKIFDGLYAGAFMVNQSRVVDPVTGVVDPFNRECYRLVNQLLSSGTMSETCAEYYYTGGGGGVAKGFTHRFVDCPVDW